MLGARERSDSLVRDVVLADERAFTPLLVTLALKIRSLVGAEQAPQSLALVTGVGGLLSLFAAPVFGRLGDRTSARAGMRRP